MKPKMGLNLSSEPTAEDLTSSQTNAKHNVSGRFIYTLTNQWSLTEGTLLYNFNTGEEDVIISYNDNVSATTANGRRLHCSAFALGAGWAAVQKTYR
jgi:hypothetical protein